MTGEHKIPSQPEIVRLFGILLIKLQKRTLFRPAACAEDAREETDDSLRETGSLPDDDTAISPARTVTL